jgi:hypothetical protein
MLLSIHRVSFVENNSGGTEMTERASLADPRDIGPGEVLRYIDKLHVIGKSRAGRLVRAGGILALNEHFGSLEETPQPWTFAAQPMRGGLVIVETADRPRLERVDAGLHFPRSGRLRCEQFAPYYMDPAPAVTAPSHPILTGPVSGRDRLAPLSELVAFTEVSPDVDAETAKLAFDALRSWGHSYLPRLAE